MAAATMATITSRELIFCLHMLVCQAGPNKPHDRLSGRGLARDRGRGSSPSLVRRDHVVPDSKNRYFGVVVPQGSFSVDYRAQVDLEVYRADPAGIRETGIAHLPLEILPFLLPSRFVPSDRLKAFAEAEFAALPPGFGRVTEICNWIHDHLAYRRGSRKKRRWIDRSIGFRSWAIGHFSAKPALYLCLHCRRSLFRNA